MMKRLVRLLADKLYIFMIIPGLYVVGTCRRAYKKPVGVITLFSGMKNKRRSAPAEMPVFLVTIKDDAT